MIGLGIGTCFNKAPLEGKFLPSNISSIQAWWRFQTGLETTGGETDYTKFLDLDTLLSWDDQVGTNHCKNDQNWQRPKWNLANTACNFLDAKHWDFTNQITIGGDFTWSFRFKLNGIASEGFMGQNNTNFLEITDANTFTMDVGGATPDNTFVDVSEIEIDTWYTLHITRRGSDLKLYIDGGAFSDKQWGETQSDGDTFTIDGIGSWGEGTNEFNGLMKDVSYFSEELSAADRAKMNTYLASI